MQARYYADRKGTDFYLNLNGEEHVFKDTPPYMVGLYLSLRDPEKRTFEYQNLPPNENYRALTREEEQNVLDALFGR